MPAGLAINVAAALRNYAANFTFVIEPMSGPYSRPKLNFSWCSQPNISLRATHGSLGGLRSHHKGPAEISVPICEVTTV
jgi:hypothetical protein